MKNIVLIVPHPWVVATFQDVLGLKGHQFLQAMTAQEFHTTMELLDPVLPDLVAMTSDAPESVLRDIFEGWPNVRERMVIMIMNPTDFVVPVHTFGRSNDRESPFFKKCREILGE